MEFIITKYTNEELSKKVKADKLAEARAIIKAAGSTEWHLFDAMAFEDYDIAEEYARFYGIKYTNESITPISEAELLEWIYSPSEIMTVEQWDNFIEENNGIEYDDYNIEAMLMTACMREAYGLI